jgi:hypothetical protein
MLRKRIHSAQSVSVRPLCAAAPWPFCSRRLWLALRLALCNAVAQVCQAQHVVELLESHQPLREVKLHRAL